ncbi:MAG: molybdopterin converting factor subunit 1 [Pseudomonadota bacterium]
MKRDVLYFAWVRERIGVGRETVESDAHTAADLIAELTQRSDQHAAAFADITALRVAYDQELTTLDATLGDTREVAFFPPMTGG